MSAIDTDRFSAHLRSRSVDPERRRVLISNLAASEQSADLSQPANMGGFGRIRHFRRTTSSGWPANPLPIDPAARALGLPAPEMMRAQAIQLAACNWRCWYCFVPFADLAANPSRSEWFSAEELVGRYLAEPDPPLVLDLTGGQPDLVPEWVVWMMEALEQRGQQRRVYVWSDDNLSNDYFWRFLTEADIERVASYPLYGRVGCFKGFDNRSFAFNTNAEESRFDQQFELMGRLLRTGIDMYAYATFTTPFADGIRDAMARFVDRLQVLDENLPLRLVPLEVQVFTPVTGRLDGERTAALQNQNRAVEAWVAEVENRFPAAVREHLGVGASLTTRPDDCDEATK